MSRRLFRMLYEPRTSPSKLLHFRKLDMFLITISCEMLIFILISIYFRKFYLCKDVLFRSREVKDILEDPNKKEEINSGDSEFKSKHYIKITSTQSSFRRSSDLSEKKKRSSSKRRKRPKKTMLSKKTAGRLGGESSIFNVKFTSQDAVAIPRPSIASHRAMMNRSNVRTSEESTMQMNDHM